MAENTQNPLAKFFRQPALYIKLPSEGRWYPENSVEIPVTGEVPIYAMTAKDEITMKTPDALLNGASTVAMIQSCCPAIKNAWHMPIVDLDSILIAIRIATYGKEMEFSTVCPHCNTTNEHAVDLSIMMDKIKISDWSTPSVIDELVIKIKPQSYEDYNKNNLLNYEEQRIIQLVANDTMSDDAKMVKFGEMFNKIVDLGITQVARSIESITVTDGLTVTNKDHIEEFLANCERSIWDSLRVRMTKMREEIELKVDVTCENQECQKSYSSPFVFEQASFFV